jgi:hypothetical protein
MTLQELHDWTAKLLADPAINGSWKVVEVHSRIEMRPNMLGLLAPNGKEKEKKNG